MLNCINTHYSNIKRDKCKDNGVKLKGINGNNIILNGDKISTIRKSCDCIIFEKPYNQKVVLVELTKRVDDISDILGKFKESCTDVFDIINKCSNDDHIPEILLILITQRGGISSMERRKLEKRISIKENSYFIDHYYEDNCSYCNITNV